VARRCVKTLGSCRHSYARQTQCWRPWPKLTLATFRASRKLKADTPKQWELYDKTWEPGLRMVGLREN